MKLSNLLTLKFEQPEWKADPELAVINVILDENPNIISLIKDDLNKVNHDKSIGRQDSPSVEQVLRAAIYKEMRKLSYRDLEYAQEDSKLCEHFVKLEGRKEPFSYQVLQKYISAISPETLKQVLVEINTIAMSEGMEGIKAIKKIRLDTTVVETDIEYPTDNKLVWDSIRVLERNIRRIARNYAQEYRSNKKQAKKNFLKINLEKKAQKREEVFEEQLKLLSSEIGKAERLKRYLLTLGDESQSPAEELEKLMVLCRQVYDVAYRREIMKEEIPSREKLFSIFETHTDIIVKGHREVKFGHKVSLATGQSNLILDCEIIKGNPKDSQLFESPLQRIKQAYNRPIESVVTDGGYASKANMTIAREAGIRNIVFNKIVGSMKSVVQSKHLETKLRKWRSGIEAVISNVKRGFGLRRCTWKGEDHFGSKVLWSVIGYNFRVISNFFIGQLLLT